MAKKPGLSDLTKKFDIGGVVNNIKSLVNPGGDIPDVDPNDALGLHIAKISLDIQELIESQKEHTDSLVEISRELNSAFKALEAVRAELAELQGDDGSVPDVAESADKDDSAGLDESAEDSSEDVEKKD